jgi:hypothetical protein
MRLPAWLIAFFMVMVPAMAIATPAAAACTIPTDKVVVNVTNQSGNNNSTEAWDQFDVKVALNNLDGMAAGCSTSVVLPDIFGGMGDVTKYLNATGEATNTQQADTVAVMTITKATRTMAFVLTDYASTHTNVKAHGEASAQVNDSIKRGETQNINVRINGETVTVGTLTGATCTTDCPEVPTQPSKWGSVDSGTSGRVKMMSPVANSGDVITMVDTLTGPNAANQAFAPTFSVRGYNCVDTWGDPGLLSGGTCTEGSMNLNAATDMSQSADGTSRTYTVTLTSPATFVRLHQDMTFTGKGPWTDTVAVTVPGKATQQSHATVKRYDAGGGASGELIEVAPVVPETSMEECTEANQGATVWETVSLPTTEGVTYTQETSASHVVTVTATAGEGFTLKAAPGWTLNENGTATWTKQLESKVCATPVGPTVHTGGALAESGGNAALLWGAMGLIGLFAAAGLGLVARRHNRQSN